ncbi:hypothetical protein FRC02_000279 [Tulasnella sp. 418]|nr:hypothetical protein FRC02_000279 [Tulasnella sp. 418]
MITENVEISDVDSNEKWDWREHFGRVVGKDDPIWEKYVQVATTYNEDIIGTIGHSMDIHLVFSGLFSAVITTLIVQSDSGLLPQDQEASLMKTLGKVFYDQFNLALQILQSSGDRPSFPYIPPDDYSVNESLFYWYISLDLSLVIASGAVCMKIWLFEYRRRSKLHHVPYHYAIHHQQSCASLRRWFIFEFGDLLGCILLLDIILFFYGCSLQFTGKSYNMILTSVSNVAFGVCTALLMFVTVVGIFVPDSPYRTPISNFLQRVPRILGGYLRTDRERQHHFLLFLVFSAGIGTAAISGLILGTKEATIGYFLIICSPIILTIPFGLRDGLKMGRISHFVPLMSLSATLMLICVLLVIAVPRFRGSYYRLPYEPGLYRSGAFGILIPFIFTTIVLSHRFLTVKSRQNFPVLVFMLSCFGVVVALLLYEHLLLLQVVMAWASVVILLITSLQHEMDIEEDTREAEALGWLIGQARDRQILHSALVCIPSIANTPSRRKIISQRAHTTLSSLINAVVHASQQNCPAIIEEKRSDHNPEVNFCDRGESFLAFYLTCLSEVIGTEVRRTVKGEETPNPLPQRAPIPKQWWLQRNWYRLLTIPPSNRDIMREYCFPHDWYPFLSPSPPHSLQVDLEILSEHHNSYIRTVSQAVKSQLYPSTSSLDQIGNWPMLEDSQVLPLSFHRKYVILVELRMATAHAIEVCRHKKSQEPSLMRYLQRYCVTALNFWRVVELPQAEQFLVTALNLAFVVMERNHKAVFVASLGDAVTMKVARCIMALKRFHDSSLELGLDQADGDAQLRIMLTQAVLSALQHYLEVNLRCIARIHMLVLIERANGVDESSIVSGMQYLEYALFQIASQECSAELMKALISSLDTLFRIGDIVDIPFHPADPSCNIIPLMRHLKIQASTSELCWYKA